MGSKEKEGSRALATNRAASHEYHLLQKIADDPRDVPEPPPYPDKSHPSQTAPVR